MLVLYAEDYSEPTFLLTLTCLLGIRMCIFASRWYMVHRLRTRVIYAAGCK